ncbi:MAG: carboxypeptidase-like regulatory domain-containing protein, partial [Bacteroidales bacterium]|nr:carboxypeptidase-like regulatory domain-containing protein [Bacteroidales bacterium]
MSRIKIINSFMVKSISRLLLLVVLLANNILWAQGPNRNSNNPNSPLPTSTIKGTVVDAETNLPLPYVNVAIIQASKDSALVNGISTDNNGTFVIKQGYGDYMIRYSFIGYESQITKLKINKNNINLGVIKFVKSAEMLEGVEITSERSMMEYQLDKRVINVDKNIVSAGGSATDVLENVPSVSVDQEGNVSLRGSGNVTVLIDGRPSELLGSDLQTVLEQIPSSTIES